MDYPNITNHNEYISHAQYVFESPDYIIKDIVENEFYYIKGSDLLRIDIKGNFVSLYPGAHSKRVIEAIKNGGVIWESPTR